MITKKKIKQLTPPSGDWYQLQIEHYQGNSRIYMTRVIAWAVIDRDAEREEGKEVDDWIEGIDSNAYGQQEDMDYFYVAGEDKAPNGKLWNEVFNETPSSNWGIKVLSDHGITADLLDTKKPEDPLKPGSGNARLNGT